MVTRGGTRISEEQHADQHAGKVRFRGFMGVMEFISLYLAGQVPIKSMYQPSFEPSNEEQTIQLSPNTLVSLYANFVRPSFWQ